MGEFQEQQVQPPGRSLAAIPVCLGLNACCHQLMLQRGLRRRAPHSRVCAGPCQGTGCDPCGPALSALGPEDPESGVTVAAGSSGDHTEGAKTCTQFRVVYQKT